MTHCDTSAAYKVLTRALLCLSFLLFGVSGVFAQTRSLATTNVQKSQNWSSFTFQGQNTARMVTSATANTGDTFSLMLDMEPPCKTVSLRLTFKHQPTPLQSPIQRKWLILMRPDGINPRGGFVTYNGKVGDQFAIFTLNTVPEFAQLFQGMVAGQFVRTHLGNEDGKILAEMVFSLYGFTASYNRILNLCRQMR